MRRSAKSTNNKKANTKTTFTIEDDEEESISIESDIVIEDDDVEDNVDIGESWKNSMTSFDKMTIIAMLVVVYG